MTLEASYTSADDIPAEFKDHYVEQDGAWVIQVAGMKPESEFDAYREATKKRLAEAGAKLKAAQENGLTRDALVEILSQHNPGDKPTDGGGDSSGKLNDLERKLAAAQAKASELEQERNSEREARRTSVLNYSLTNAVASSAPREGVADVVVDIIRKQFELTDDGNVRSRADSEFGPDLKPDQVVMKVKSDPRYAPFWPQSKGSGADGDGGGAGGGDAGENPWLERSWNRTKQQEIVVRDIEQATRMAKRAGLPDPRTTLTKAQEVWRRAS